MKKCGSAELAVGVDGPEPLILAAPVVELTVEEAIVSAPAWNHQHEAVVNGPKKNHSPPVVKPFYDN